jgi:hypothetical protein
LLFINFTTLRSCFPTILQKTLGSGGGRTEMLNFATKITSSRTVLLQFPPRSAETVPDPQSRPSWIARASQPAPRDDLAVTPPGTSAVSRWPSRGLPGAPRCHLVPAHWPGPLPSWVTPPPRAPWLLSKSAFPPRFPSQVGPPGATAPARPRRELARDMH